MVKIEDHFNNKVPRCVWQGIQPITNFRCSSSMVVGDASLAEELNRFFARFEETAAETNPTPPPVSNSLILTLQEHDVRCVLRALNPRKAAGLDGVSGRFLKECEDRGELVRTFLRDPSSTCP